MWHEARAIFKRFGPIYEELISLGVGTNRVMSGMSPQGRVTTRIYLAPRASHLSLLSIFWFNPENNTVKSEESQTQNLNGLPQVTKEMSYGTITKSESSVSPKSPARPWAGWPSSRRLGSVLPKSSFGGSWDPSGLPGLPIPPVWRDNCGDVSNPESNSGQPRPISKEKSSTFQRGSLRGTGDTWRHHQAWLLWDQNQKPPQLPNTWWVPRFRHLPHARSPWGGGNQNIYW